MLIGFQISTHIYACIFCFVIWKLSFSIHNVIKYLIFLKRNVMHKVVDGRNYMLLHHDGAIHFPFSKFLTNEFTNPNTRDLVSQSLRIFYRFCTANKIELAIRALEGRCITYDECKKLANLCFRPIQELESASDKKVIAITSARAGKSADSLAKAVQPNTAMARLAHIAGYLDFYKEVFLLPHLRSSTLRETVQQEFSKSAHQLRSAIRGTKQGHHHDIQSLPSNKFFEIIRAIFVRPEELFLTASGKPASTLYRDRAMALLACECLRPGSIGNVARSDFRPESRHLVIADHRDRRPKPTSSTPMLKLGASTLVNSASEGMIELWPFTTDAICQYIDIERKAILSKHLKNRSDGFLFLSIKGEPIRHRSVLTAMFRRLGDRLAKIGLLDVTNDPYFRDQKHYDFYAYVLRHSSASLFLEIKGTDDRALDMMKPRYGWTMNSTQPQRYAARAISDQANVDLMAFNEALMMEVRKKATNRGNGDDI